MNNVLSSYSEMKEKVNLANQCLETTLREMMPKPYLRVIAKHVIAQSDKPKLYLDTSSSMAPAKKIDALEELRKIILQEI